MSLRIDSLEYRIGNFKILDNVTAAAQRGEIIGIVGPNGSGKSTLANIITGIVRPSSGQVSLDGKVLSKLPPWQIAENGISRMFQDQHLAWNLSAKENMVAMADAVSGISMWSNLSRAATVNPTSRSYSTVAAMLERLGLLEQENVPARDLSFGQQRLLAIGKALLRKGKVVVLDEPFVGMQPDSVAILIRLIREEKDTRAWLVIDHGLRWIREIAGRVWYMHRGRLTTFLDYRAMEDSQLFRESYFGLLPAEEKPDPVTSSTMSEGQSKPSELPFRRHKIIRESSNTKRPLMSIRGLSAGYGGRTVVSMVDFDLLVGEVLCIVGPNGSGKSTLLRAIMGFPQHLEGDVLLDGKSLAGMNTEKRVHLGLRLLLQEGRVMRSFSVRESLTLSVAGLTNTSLSFRGVPLYAHPDAHMAVNAAETTFCREAKTSRPHQKTGTLSGGEQAQLALIELQIGLSRVVLLDEPAAGIDGIARSALMGFIAALISRGAGVIVVEHDLDFVASVASRIAVLADSTLQELTSSVGDSEAQIALALRAKTEL